MKNNEQIELVDPSFEMIEDIINIRKDINTSNTFMDYEDKSEYEKGTDEVKKEIENCKNGKIWKIIQVKNNTDKTPKNIGFVLFYLNRLKRRKHIAEFSIGIIKDESGKGYGSKSIDKAIELAKDNDIKIIKLTVDTKNQRAISLYMSKGFIICGCIKNSKYVCIKEDTYEFRDEYIMTLTIQK